MQAWAILGALGLLHAACGGRVEQRPGIDDGSAGSANGGMLSGSVIGAGGSREKAPPLSGLGASGQGSPTLPMHGEAGGPDDIAEAGAPNSGCERRSLSAGSLSPRWEVVGYNPCQGDESGLADEYHSLWADGANRVWVSASIMKNNEQPTRALLRWDKGSFFSEISNCQPNIVTVHGITNSDRWFAGCGGSLLHSEGSFWMPLKNAPKLTRVWANSTTDLWGCCVPGDNGGLAVTHWDGSNWTTVSLPSAMDQGGALWSSGPADLWIADRDVLHWDGMTWQLLKQPDVQGWRGVFGDGVNVWAVGRGSGSEIARWNGLNFEALATSGVLPEGVELEGVWARAPNDVWFVGLHGAVVHWNGLSLERESTGLDVNLFGVWGAGDALWVSGAQETLMRRTLN